MCSFVNACMKRKLNPSVQNSSENDISEINRNYVFHVSALYFVLNFKASTSLETNVII